MGVKRLHLLTIFFLSLFFGCHENRGFSYRSFYNESFKLSVPNKWVDKRVEPLLDDEDEYKFVSYLNPEDSSVFLEISVFRPVDFKNEVLSIDSLLTYEEANVLKDLPGSSVLKENEVINKKSVGVIRLDNSKARDIGNIVVFTKGGLIYEIRISNIKMSKEEFSIMSHRIIRSLQY